VKISPSPRRAAKARFGSPFPATPILDAHVALGAFLRQLEREAAQKQVVQFTCDFRQLYFMNSACFKCFVVWINDIAGLTRELQYVVEFVTNPNMHWQRRSLENLQYFGPSIVRITA
jgi:hypothetical protein